MTRRADRHCAAVDNRCQGRADRHCAVVDIIDVKVELIDIVQPWITDDKVELIDIVQSWI